MMGTQPASTSLWGAAVSCRQGGVKQVWPLVNPSACTTPARGTAWSYLHALQNFIHSSEMKMCFCYITAQNEGKEKKRINVIIQISSQFWSERLALQQPLDKETLCFLTTTLYSWNHSAFFLFLLKAIISLFIFKIHKIFDPIYSEIYEVFGGLLISVTYCLEVHTYRRLQFLFETHQRLKLRYNKGKVQLLFKINLNKRNITRNHDTWKRHMQQTASLARVPTSRVSTVELEAELEALPCKSPAGSYDVQIHNSSPRKRNNKVAPWGKQPKIAWALWQQGIKPQKVHLSEGCRDHKIFSIQITISDFFFKFYY